MTLKIVFSSKMKKHYKRMKKRGKDMSKLHEVISMLAERTPLPARMRDHALVGTYAGQRECHIEPDWLLVYRIVEDQLILTATDTGTHADLYGM